MASDLSKVGERERLKARREPYWNRLRAGCFLGFRPSKRGGAGSWVARAYDEDKRSYRLKALGDFGDLAGKDRFTAAKKEAEAFAEQVEAGGVVVVRLETVGDACRAYSETKPDAEGRFKRYVYGDPLAKVRLDKLRKRHLMDWRARLEATPAQVSRRKKGEKRIRERAPATINRDMAALRAALTKVIAPGTPKTEAAWQEALRAIPNADRQRTLYLGRGQRRTLLAQVQPEAAPFVEALCLLPLRPGAIAALTVGDFDRRTNELTIDNDKIDKRRRIQVPEQAATLLASQSEDKLPTAPIFMRANGKPWDKNSWKLPIRVAAEEANLPAGVTAYTLRHSTITDLVQAGLPLLTIAQISGTSAEMIEKHYGHLTSDFAVAALSQLAF